MKCLWCKKRVWWWQKATEFGQHSFCDEKRFKYPAIAKRIMAQHAKDTAVPPKKRAKS